MKRFISTFLTLCFIVLPIFSEEIGDEYDDGYVYESNGKGDQFLKFDFAGIFPLGFKGTDSKTGAVTKQLQNGASFDLGYYRFLNKWFALGGEVTFTSNWSIGEKLLVTIPITSGVLFQPFAGNFEFPIYLNLGIGYESWANTKYFPSLAAKGSTGVYYRITEAWSAGASASFLWIPQWFKDNPEYNYNAKFIIASIGGRFHF